MSQGTPWKIDERDFPASSGLDEQARFLVGYAVLAPSSHNTQPWRFAIDGPVVELSAEPKRWLRIADRDQRELHISLGCALENLLIAAEHFGLAHAIEYFPDPQRPEVAAKVTLSPAGESSPVHRPPELFSAILERHTNRLLFEPEPVPAEALDRLRAVGSDEGIRLFLTSEPEVKDWIERLIVDADERRFADPEWRAELAEWVGRGAFGDPWPVAKLSQLVVRSFDLGRSTGAKDAHTFSSSPVFGLFASLEDTRESQVRVGQAFERIYLVAHSLGLALQPLSALLELPEPKTVLKGILGLGSGVPQQPFRLGFGPRLRRHVPRRTAEEVLTG